MRSVISLMGGLVLDVKIIGMNAYFSHKRLDTCMYFLMDQEEAILPHMLHYHVLEDGLGASYFMARH